jgi:hypothetical protein
MKTCKIILLGIMLFASLSCRLFSPETQTREATTYENDAFSFTIPAGWGTMLSGGDYYDLNVEKIVTVYDTPVGIGDLHLVIWSKAFFTVASAPLDAGTDLESRFAQTYGQFENLWDTYKTDVKKQAFEYGTLSGQEIYYSFPYGEAWYQFHDIWLEQDGLLYVLSSRTNANEFENYKGFFDQIIDSFCFKE